MPGDRAGFVREHAPRVLLRTAEQVARDGYRGFMAGRRVVVPGLPNKIVVGLLRYVPRGIVLALTDRQLRGRNSHSRHGCRN